MRDLVGNFLAFILIFVFAIGGGMLVEWGALPGLVLGIVVFYHLTKDDRPEPKPHPKPIRDVVEALERRQRVDAATTVSGMHSLEPVEFELLVGRLFERRGYDVRHAGRTGDQGIDLIVTKGAERGVVQCKRYKESVGQPVVRDLFGVMVHEVASTGYIVTTGYFTEQAKEWARGKPIELIDGRRLNEWMGGDAPREEGDLTFYDLNLY